MPSSSPLLRFAAAVLAASGFAFPAGAATLAELAAAIDRPQVGAAVDLGGPLAVGRGELTAGGNRARLLLAGGEPCGLLLAGPVELRYRIEDRFSRPVAKQNLAKASSRRTSEDGSEVRASFAGGAAVWGWELAAAAAAKAGGGAAEPAGGALPGWVDEILARPFFAPPSSELIAARRLGGSGVVYALLEGSGEPWLLAVDPVQSREEAVYRLEKLPQIYLVSKGRHVAYELASQPVGREWWDRFPAPTVVRHRALGLHNPGGSTVAVTSRSRVEAARPGVGLWRVDLIDRLVDADLKEWPVEVRSVQVGGQPADYLFQGSELLVALDPPLAQGAAVEIEVVHTGEFAMRPGSDSYWWLSTAAWYPMPSLNGELAEVDLEVRTPEPFVAFASGETLERRSEGGLHVLRSRLPGRNQYPVVAAGNYKTVSDQRDGLTVHVASYAFAQEKEGRRLMQLVFAAADVLGKVLGAPYPFAELDVVEIKSWGFGQAPPGVIFITQEAYNPIASTENRLFSAGINERIVHEVAHGWWGHVIKVDSSEENWLSESFAEYSAALALQAMAGGKKGEREFKSILHAWVAATKQIRPGGSVYLAGRLAGEDERDFWDRTWLLYAKGPLVLHALRQELGRKLGSPEKGDQYFFALLRSFIKNFGGGYGETRHLVGILDQITGETWQPWFERYVYGTETPAVVE